MGTELCLPFEGGEAVLKIDDPNILGHIDSTVGDERFMFKVWAVVTTGEANWPVRFSNVQVGAHVMYAVTLIQTGTTTAGTTLSVKDGEELALMVQPAVFTGSVTRGLVRFIRSEQTPVA